MTLTKGKVTLGKSKVTKIFSKLFDGRGDFRSLGKKGSFHKNKKFIPPLVIVIDFNVAVDDSKKLSPSMTISKSGIVPGFHSTNSGSSSGHSWAPSKQRSFQCQQLLMATDDHFFSTSFS